MDFRAIAIGVLLAFSVSSSAQEVLWTYKPPVGSVDASPAIVDINGDGKSEIIVGSAGGVMSAIDADGKEIWQHPLPGRLCFPITVADITGDNALDALTMNDEGQVFCLMASSGAEIWRAALPGSVKWGRTALASADLNGDSAPEIVLGLEGGAVVCLNGAGEQAWVAQTDCRNLLCPAIADVDEDGKTEILVSGAEVPLICLSSEGKEQWRLNAGTGGSPFVCSLDGKGDPTILIGVDNSLLALDGHGKTRWSCPMHKAMDSAISFGDADENGEIEIYAVDLSGYMACISPKGQVLWSAELGERVRRSPSIGDIDGDGVCEILTAGYSRALFVFDPQGRLESRTPLAGSVNSTPTLACLGDAGLCAVVPVVGEGVLAFHWKGSRKDAKVLWPEFRYDSTRLGVVCSDSTRDAISLTVDFGGIYVGNNIMKATVLNPEKRKLNVRLEMSGASSEPVSTIVDSTREIIEPALWYTVPGTAATNLSFVCAVSQEGRVIARRTRAAYVTPFVKELSDAEKAIREAEDCFPRMLDAGGLEDRACFLLARLEKLRGQVPHAGMLEEDERIALREALRTILKEADSLSRLAKAAEDAAKLGSQIRVCAANPWAPFGGMDELSEGRLEQKEMTVEAFGNDVESAAMNVYNLSNIPRTFYVETGPLKQGDKSVTGSQAVSLFEAVQVHTEMRLVSTDALPRLNNANLLQVPAWSARQLWMNVDAGKLGSGCWTGGIRLRSLDLVPQDISFPLKVEVWKATLPARQALRNCGWGYVESSQLKDFPEAALEDQVYHHTDVFVSVIYPKAQFDSEGNLVGEVDYTEHDAYVKRHSPHGIILFCGYQGSLQGPAPVDSEAYAKAHVAWLRDWVKHLAEMGVGYDGFALYPVDEPGLSKGLVDIYLRMAKLAREADPKILLYTDPVENITTDELRSMMPYVDIWCPNRTGLVNKKESSEKLRLILDSGKPVWTYECFANAKHQSPTGYYRAQAWLAWRHGISGIGFWTYCTSPDNPWFVAPARSEYMLVYPGHGVVSSKRWEAVREGVEDYTLLAALRDAVKSKGAAAKPEDIEAANQLLGEQASAIGDYCQAPNDEIHLGDKGFPGLRILEDQHWAQIQKARRELARLLDIFSN